MEIKLSSLLFPAQDSVEHFALIDSRQSFLTIKTSAYEIPKCSNNNNHLPDLDTTTSDDTRKLTLSKIFQFIEIVWPDALLYIGYLCKNITVLPLNGQRWINWSSPKEPNTVTVTISLSDFATSSETLIHEASHLAFYKIETLANVFLSGAKSTYRHYWKPGNRPPRGAMLAAHAFLNVALFYEYLAKLNPQRYKQYAVESCILKERVKKVLLQFDDKNDLTPFGEMVLSDLRQKSIS